MTAVSDVTICNLALGWLGANLIISLDDAGDEAALCKANYGTSRDATLEARNWTFASSRKRLIPLAEAPEFGYSYQFQLPADNIRVLVAGNDPKFRDDLDWLKEEDKILSDVQVLYILYTKRIEDPQKFSSGFVHAFAARLASDMAVPLTNSKDMQQLMAQLYLGKLEVAGVMDGIQGKNTKLVSNQLVRVR